MSGPLFRKLAAREQPRAIREKNRRARVSGSPNADTRVRRSLKPGSTPVSAYKSSELLMPLRSVSLRRQVVVADSPVKLAPQVNRTACRSCRNSALTWRFHQLRGAASLVRDGVSHPGALQRARQIETAAWQRFQRQAQRDLGAMSVPLPMLPGASMGDHRGSRPARNRRRRRASDGTRARAARRLANRRSPRPRPPMRSAASDPDCRR